MTMMRTRLAGAWLLLLLGSVAGAQTLTVMPVPRQQFLDNNGDPLSGGLLYTYEAGTTTALATCADSTNPCTNPNANPVVLDSAGRATVYLTSSSYKFVLQTSAGVTIWTQDQVSSVAPFNVDLDVTATAGVAIAAGEVAYLSDGSGSLTAGRWYLADADTAYSSITAGQVGMAQAAIASGSSGSIRLIGRITGLSGLTAGSKYYASATAGALTATAPTNALFVGTADSTTTLILSPNPVSASGPRGPPCGRLTLTSGTPVTTADVTAATTLYYAPYGGCNQIQTYNGFGWGTSAFTELSIAVPAVATQMYDVFVYDNAGTLTLELTAWTNDTTRATALTTQNGVYVKTGALTRLYLGSVRTVASGQLNDSLALRHVWNYYHRVERLLARYEGTDSWSYSTATWRQANGAVANQVEIVVGVAEVLLDLQLIAFSSNNNANIARVASIGEGSTTTPMTTSILYSPQPTTWPAAQRFQHHATVRKYPAVGYQYYAWLEYSDATATTTWLGDNTASSQSGLSGWIWG